MKNANPTTSTTRNTKFLQVSYQYLQYLLNENASEKEIETVKMAIRKFEK